MSRPVLLVLCIASTVSCTGSSVSTEPVDAPTPDASTASPAAPAAAEPDFYHLSQGSESLSLLLFQNIERVDSTALFRDDLQRYGLIPDATSATNPYGLPIGLTAATHDNSSQPMVGQTCAACHVGRIEYQGQGATYDGVPNLFRSTDFFRELSLATRANFDDKHKLERLLERVLDEELGFGVGDGPLGPLESAFLNEVAAVVSEQRRKVDAEYEGGGRGAMRKLLLTNPHAGSDQGFLDRLADHPVSTVEDQGRSFLASLQSEAEKRGRLAAELARLAREARLSFALLRYIAAYGGVDAVPHTPDGPGRTDAFGRVRAQVLPQMFGPGVVAPLTAPASTPPLFDIQTVTWLHYNGNTQSAMERNIIEAIGSGAVVDAYTHDSWVEIENLSTLEFMTYGFEPPPWPDFLPPIDAELAKAGEPLFAEHCASCHKARTTRGKAVHPRFSVAEIGTDANHAANFVQPVDGQALPDLMTALSVGVKQRYYDLHGIDEADRQQLQGMPGDGGFRDPGSAVLAARPLTAVWSTAPYLHNGSVPTLHDLLLPPDQRPKRFPVGHREYDPVKVGYVTEVDEPVFVFDVDQPVLDGQGQPMPGIANGNSNGGHTYGTDLSPSQRDALLEFLKTL